MKKKKFRVSVYHFDPQVDAAPYYSRYEVDMGDKVKVLDVLKHIYHNCDGELAFRSSCGIGKCGCCGVRVNGKPVLACREYTGKKDILIEPLANYPVIKDLIVDREGHSGDALLAEAGCKER